MNYTSQNGSSIQSFAEKVTENKILNHLIRRNLITQVDSLIQPIKENRNSDLLSQIQEKTLRTFRKSLIDQITKKENDHRTERDRTLIEQSATEKRIFNEMGNIQIRHSSRKQDSLILNGNKILNESKTIDDVLNEMKNAQKVSLIDLQLTESAISKPLLKKQESKYSRFAVQSVLNEQIVKKASFNPNVYNNVYDQIDSQIGKKSLNEKGVSNRLHLVQTLKKDVLDCTDVYQMMEEERKKNKIRFNKMY